ncbi:MAG: efflux RND transporter permease subunit [Pseudomonadota bacterium]
MSFYARFIRNHPLANITFVVVLILGLFSYLKMPREQDPEINFNWVAITTVLPGASAEDVEKLVTRPLEDATRNVADIRFVSSSSRENVSSILIRFRDIDERIFDKRVTDLRREIQNEAAAELPREAEDPVVLEVTTSNGFPTAMVVLTGPANDENLRSQARLVRDDLERLAGVDRVYANGLRDPELLVEFSPALAQARGVTPTDIADSVGAWFRDTFAGKRRAADEEWLVRVLGQQPDPGFLARINVASARDPRHAVPLDAIAEVSRARERAERLVSQNGQPAVMLAITKKSYTNTLELVERINGYLAERNRVLAPLGLRLALLDDQTVPTREAIDVMESNAVLGLLVVLGMCWVFLGTRIAFLVSLGVPFALAGTFAILHALGYTLNISVLLGVVIALGMLVDDAVVVVEAIYYRVQRGQEVLAAAVARWIRLNVDGEIVAVMRDAGEKVEVRVRAQPGESRDIARLLDQPIALAGGTTTLGALTDYETRIGKGIIKRYNLRRAITVEADLDKEQTDTVAANRLIQREWDRVRARYPNVSLDFSGELDDIQESLDAMPLLFFMGVGIIYLILAAQFRSYWQPLMILVTVPLAFTGVVLGLLVSRVPLSLYTMYGVIALTGIAVNSAIVLIDAANERLRAGMSVLHAAVYAGRRRVVPIIITTVTTIGGLFSLAFGIAGKSLLWGPVASSIVWGLGFATLLTLFVIPLLYWTFMRPRTGRSSRLRRLLPFGAKP